MIYGGPIRLSTLNDDDEGSDTELL